MRLIGSGSKSIKKQTLNEDSFGGLLIGLRQILDVTKNALRVLLTLAALWVCAEESLAADAVTMDLRVVDGNFHLEFMGAVEWDYDLERKQLDERTVIELRIPGLKEQSGEQMKTLPKNEVVESMFLTKVPGGAKDILTINLKSNFVESFDYLTEKPSRLVVDLYLTKKAQGLAQAKPAESRKGSSAPLPVKQNQRKPAMDELTSQEAVTEKVEPPPTANLMAGIFDGGDPKFERFAVRDYEIKQEAIVRSRENLYIPFPMLNMEGQHFEQIKSQKPVYEIVAKNTAENKMARLVLTLFEKNRSAVCLKTAMWFLEKFPASEYEEIIRYLIGDVHFKMWELNGSRASYESSMQAYREALLKYPNSLLAMRTKFLIGYSTFSNKDYFAALQTFQGIIKNPKPSFLRDKAQLTVARSLMRLNQSEEALKNFEQVEKDGFAEANRVEATYLKGDVYFFAKNYERASAAYREAAQKYPKFLGLYPNALYNLAESLFWLKQYKPSLDANREFLTRFPSHLMVPFAMARAGETMEILGAEPRRVMGAFLETYFRFGGTDGAAVARIRVISDRLKDMREKEAEKAITEVRKITETVPLPGLDLFGTIMIAEGLGQRKEYARAIDTLLKWYQNNPATRDARIIKRRVERHVNEKMEADLDKGDFFAALKLHNEFGELWLKGSSRIDTVYNLGRAFEQAGAYLEADALFRDTANLLTAAKNSAQAIEHSVFEHLPTLDEVFLRLARVKAELGESSKAYDYLREIKEPTKLGDAQQIERMEVGVRLLKAKGDFEAAKTYLRELIENWKGQALQIASARRTLAELEMDSKAYSKAESLLKNNLSDLSDANRESSDLYLVSQKLLSDVYVKTDKVQEQIELLQKMLELNPDEESLSPYRYRLGKAFFDQGNTKKAREVWAILEQKKAAFWWGLAQNNLKESEWKETYQKYIKRIPAMVKSNINEKGKEPN